MKITKIRYVDETKNWVSLTFSDGSTATCSLKDGIKRQYTDKVKEYLENRGIIEPQFSNEKIAQNNQNKINQEALQYLAKTDWYILREAESQKQCPEEIKIKREEARKRIKW